MPMHNANAYALHLDGFHVFTQYSNSAFWAQGRIHVSHHQCKIKVSVIAKNCQPSMSINNVRPFHIHTYQETAKWITLCINPCFLYIIFIP